MDDIKFDFRNLFIFEMANNHQGDVSHGTRIVRELAGVANTAGVRAAIKLQFRDLDSFIHPAHRVETTNKHIPRFLSTRLSEDQFRVLVAEIRERGFVSVVTPFDEPSVHTIIRLGVDVIKIGSCSANDWPLLEEIAQAGKPVICSTAGLRIEDIDKIVSFFEHRRVHFALMHCVALYPTPREKLQLNQIEALRKRYPEITIGFSTHEDPTDTEVIKLAYAKGARIFEKHVAIPTEEYKINAYSATPEQIATWLAAWRAASDMCGAESRPPADPAETESLRSLMRGVYAKQPIEANSPLTRENVYFSMPASVGQMVSGEWRETLRADRDYRADEAIAFNILKRHHAEPKFVIAHIVHELKGMLNTAGIAVGSSPNLELSHHYGLARFREYGAALIDCINREYCKKIILQLPGQKHPYHYHQKKEEAFQVLYGALIVEMEGRESVLHPGDVLVVPRAAWHRFRTDGGVIFEEVSTTHFNDDSFYEDPMINRMTREERKTKLINWGFRQFD